MAFKFPFTNYHELNLTWVLDQLKKLFEESQENVETIETYENRLSAVEQEVPVIEENAQQALNTANAAASLAQTAKSTADTAQENALTASAQAGQARAEAEDASADAQSAIQAAQQAQATAQNFDGRITQAQDDASAALEASQSFENRVNAAINTANNAANTATIAQGIAVNANQNAANALDIANTADGKADTALSEIGDLSDLQTTVKTDLVSAINEAVQSGGVTSVNGKTGAVTLDASDIPYNSGTVATELPKKQDAPESTGAAGQVLTLDDSLNPVWDFPSGSGGLDSDVTYYISSSPTAFNQNSVYSVRALVSYEGKVWECHTAVTEPGPFTGTDNWTEEGVISNDNNSGLAANDPINIEKALSLIPKNLNGNKVTLEFVASIYRGTASTLYIQNFFGGTLIFNGNGYKLMYYGSRMRGIVIYDVNKIILNNIEIRTTYRGSGLRVYRSVVFANNISSIGGGTWENPYTGTGFYLYDSTLYVAGGIIITGTNALVAYSSIIQRYYTEVSETSLTAPTLTCTATSNSIINESSLIMLGASLILPGRKNISTGTGGITNATERT